jgi:hypothetical protein
LSAQVQSAADTRNTNNIPFAIAPRIESLPDALALDAEGKVNVPVACSPHLRPGQDVFLSIGDQSATPDGVPLTHPANSASFTFHNLEPSDVPLPVRLRVDGIDSRIIDMTQSPPVFSGPSVTVT